MSDISRFPGLPEVRASGFYEKYGGSSVRTAFPLEAGSRDAFLFVLLEPGLYTVTLSGKDDAEGVGLIEVYEVR